MPIIIFILLMLFSPLTYAETCVNDYGGNSSCAEDAEHTTAGDCATLGYTATSCADGESFLKCPFDESKRRCIENAPTPRTCEELGFTETSCDEGVSSKACPIEETPQKYACGTVKEKSCAELGFREADKNDDKSSWCAKIITCEENGDKYTLCATVKSKTEERWVIVPYGKIDWDRDY